MTFEETYRVLTYGPSMIHVESEPVLPEDYADLPRLRRYMVEVMRRFEGVGLAAPQIGVFKSFIVFEDQDGTTVDMVNPYIARMYGKELEEEEGCLSLPPSGNVCLVPRMECVEVEAGTSRYPERRAVYKLRSMSARVVQHEIDHLDGTFFIDRVSEKRRRLVMEQFKEWEYQRNARMRHTQRGNGNADAGIVAARGPKSRLS